MVDGKILIDHDGDNEPTDVDALMVVVGTEDDDTPARRHPLIGGAQACW